MTQLRATLAIALISILALSACDQIGPTDEEDDPLVNSTDAPQEPTEPVNLTEASSALQGTNVYVDNIEILLMESWPLQASAIVTGNLADGCVSLNGFDVNRVDTTFTLTPLTERDADALCIQALVPFEESAPLDIFGLDAGMYTVTSGNVSANFTLDMDNILPEDMLPEEPPVGTEPAGDEKTLGDPLPVNTIMVETGHTPTNAIVTLQLTVPNGCIEYLVVTEGQMDTSITLNVFQDVPSNVACLAALTDTEVTHILTELSIGIRYTIDAGGVSETYTTP